MLRILILGIVLALGFTSFVSSEEKPPVISSEDTLRWENLALKLQLHQEHVQIIQKDIAAAQATLEGERKALDERFKSEYKLPLERLTRRDGKWIVSDPKPAEAPKKK